MNLLRRCIRSTPLLLLLATLTSVANAEYRAFQLAIRNTKSGTERTVQSNLDPDQYREYYHLEPDEHIRYTDTWMCWGRTDEFSPICPKPERAPAAVTAPPQSPDGKPSSSAPPAPGLTPPAQTVIK